MWQDSLMCYFRPAVIYLAVEQMKGTWYLEGTFRWSLPIPSLRNANTPAVAAHPVALWLRCQHFGECGCWREVGGSMLRCRQLSIYTDNDILQGWGLDLLGVSALQCSWNRSTLRGKDFRSYSQKRTLALFWLCLSNTVRGGGSISVKRDLTGVHQHKSLYPLFSLDLTQRLCHALAISLPASQNVLRERSCVTHSLPRGTKVKVWIFLAGLWKKQKRNTPWSPRGTVSSGEWVTLSSFVRILPTNASQFVMWRELLRFMERKDGCLLAWYRTWAPSTTALATVCLGSCSDLVFAATEAVRVCGKKDGYWRSDFSASLFYLLF